MKRLAILTNIDANHGSVIFNVSLDRILAESFPDHSVAFLDCAAVQWRLYELLRMFKLRRKIPLYNYRRHRCLMDYSHEHLEIEPFPSAASYDRAIAALRERDYDTLVVGKVVWDILTTWKTPGYPNVFWLSDQLDATKIAYAASGHRTDMDLFRRHESDILKNLSSYALIGVRDDMTEEMMAEAGVDRVVPVRRMSDPAFLFEPRTVTPEALCESYGIDPGKPILALLYYGKPELSEVVREHYHAAGYQILNFNMYNPYADINIGHLVDPDEYASLFGMLSFCITDRFHSSVFCLRNGVPFAAIEPYRPSTPLNSKVHSLLDDFGVVDPCYFDQYAEGFDARAFVNACDEIERAWDGGLRARVAGALETQLRVQRDFIAEMAGLA
jgi:hypothetical protein